MKKMYLLIVLCLLNVASYALFGPCTPGSIGTGYSGTLTYCAGATATPITYNYSECSVAASGAPSGVACMATWYYNTTNSNIVTGGTVTFSGPIAFTSAAGTMGDLPTFTPSTATAGIRYYFCVVTWAAGGTCTTAFKTSTARVQINANPLAVTGLTNICVGATTVYTDPSSGGMSWTSSTPSVATIGSASGAITGISAGTADMTFTTTAGCIATKTISINAIPAAITGTLSLCTGTTSTLADADAGGTWTSSSAGIASIGSVTGVVSGNVAGTSVITYTLTGCRRVTAVTVNSVAAVSGVTPMCQSATFTFTDATSGGTWISDNTGVATVGVTGLVTATGAGTANIMYLSPNGCTASKALTVNPAPAAITGSGTTCPSATTMLSESTTGGTWSSSNNAIATAGTDGTITGAAAGTVNIWYILPTTCKATFPMTVNANPAVIAGTLTACEGLTSTVTDASGGGTWSSSTSAVGTVNSGTGLVTAIAAGTTLLTYTVGTTGCYRTGTYIVKANPSAITGTLSACPGTTTVLSGSGSGASWASSTTGVATINSGGVATGVTTGTTNITYTLTTGCYTISALTVNPTPAAFTGTLNACIGSTSTLGDADAGGTWSSSNTARATVGSADGIVTGITVGTVLITYTLPTGCFRTGTFTVNSLPPAISGIGTVCVGFTAALSDATGGGTWSTANSSVATVGTSGIVSGAGAGVVDISYILAAGCYATQSMTVIATPAANTGTATLCAGATTTLSNSTSGGAWSSSNTSAAVVGSATGVVTGVAGGTSNIIYTIGAGCTSTTPITVNPNPAAITGSNNVCEGASITLSCATSGGTWTSSAAGTATVGSSTGVVTGVAGGPVTITYSLASGCYRTFNVAVNALPAAIGGATPSVCAGTTAALTDATPGGAWTITSTSIATVGYATGIVTGVSNTGGTATVYYTVTTGCRIGIDVTVNPSPSAITGNATVCIGLVTTLTSATSGGTWSSGTPAIGTIDPATGDVTGISGGTTVITYTAPTTCFATRVVTVITAPAIITGTASACPGFTTTLSDATTGGAWSSSDGTIATVGTSGVVTAVLSGNATISYALGVSCYSTLSYTVNASTPITGTQSVCVASTTTLADAASGGTWASGTSTVAPVNASGVVTGVAAGTTNITYTPPSGCRAIAVVTVNAQPAVITGTANACAGNMSTLSDATAGGTWASSATGTATVGSATGVVNGLVAGVANISYIATTGCYRLKAFTVNPIPAAISGASSVCVGKYIVLSDASSGGVSWTSSNTGVATVSASSGAVSGISGGTTTITYLVNTGCYATTDVTVNALPGSITGTATVCAGSTTTLNCTPGGGTWLSGTTGAATIGSSTGVVTGIAAGTSLITYTTTGGCTTFKAVTVTAMGAISGPSALCTGATATFTDPTPGGAWSDDGSGFATIGSSASGLVTAVAAGTTNIYYTSSNGCIATATVTVNDVPSAFSDPTLNSVCPGATITVTVTPTGGTWTSSNTSIATVGSASGDVTGVSAGQVSLTYAIGTGCNAVTTATVNPLPAAITGTASVCYGLTTTLADATPGGTWSSIDGTVATVGTTGIVTGAAPDTTTILYTISTGCKIGVNVTVNSNPAPIDGPSSLCQGSTASVTDPSSGGLSWTSSAPSIATVGTFSGLVTAISAGVATITYTAGTGCIATLDINVDPLPSAIGGTASACIGSTSTLTASGGDVWASANLGVAIVGAGSGVVTGVSAGTAMLSYAVSATGCYTSVIFTVNPLPAAITGGGLLCVASSTTLSTASSGGTWTSGSVNASVVSTTGVVTGANPGTAIITYTLPTGCIATKTVTVLAAPAAITGTQAVCVGLTTTLADATSGGTWSSSATGTATVGSTTGIVTGVAGGMATLSYSLGAGCTSTAAVTVNPLPASITGTTTLCVGATQTLSSTDVGGTWTSSVTGRATVGSSSGIVTGISSGTATITYTLGTGCYTTAAVTVNAISGITGSPAACVGTTTSLADVTAGGTWSSSNGAVGTVGTTGIVTGISAGTTAISYIIASTGCFASQVVTVSTFPSVIGGPSTVCTGTTITLTNTAPGGTWISSASSFASIGASSGIVTGVLAGTSNITYTIGSGTSCRVFSSVTVNSAPANIGGTANSCVGLTATLTDGTASGTWSSSTPAIADIGSATGVVTSYSAGTATMSYILTTGCYKTTTYTAKANPSANTGTPSVCVGATTAISNATPGGVSWTSADGTIATIAGSGVVTGISAGAVNVTYLNGNGCYAITNVTVNPIPATFTGTATMCAGFTTTLNTTPSGGTWTSSAPTVGTIDPSTGVVTGITAGTSFITYTLATGCRKVGTVTVNAVAAISGIATICEGLTATLTDGTSGGTWASGNLSAITIGSTTGVITAVAAGVAGVTYTSTAGCVASKSVTVNPNPAITGGGSASLCAGLSAPAYTVSIAGGIWATSAASIATIGTSSGIATATNGAGGVAGITYTIATGCKATTTLTVNPLPAAIGGTLSACAGNMSTLTDATASGTWISSNTAVGTIDPSSGTVTGIVAGTTLITYTVTATGCIKSSTFVVNPIPAAISGSSAVCMGSTTPVTDVTPGGQSWISSTPSVATVGSISGIVSGIAAGVTTITYNLSTGCYITTPMTVNPLPAAVGGGTSIICEGSSTAAFTNATPGGSWVSGNTSVATVGSATGIATGTASGIVAISYALTTTGCATTAALTVNPNAPISGTQVVCVGSITTLSGTAGGTWSSTLTANGTVDATSGNVTGIAAGTTTISYLQSTGCVRAADVTINPVPAAITAAGAATQLCVAATLDLDDATTGGTWASSSITIATIGSVETDGLITGVSAGAATMSYILAITGCYATYAVTVNPLPAVYALSNTGSTGFPINLSNSETGVSYELFKNAVSQETAAGTGSGFDFTTVSAGASDSWTAVGTNTVTGCTANMAMLVAKPAGSFIDGQSGNVTFGNVSVYPNPNNGTFSVNGTFGQGVDKEVSLEITNVLGQVIYRNAIIANKGNIDQLVSLDRSLANGMYMLTLRSGSEKAVFHFVVQQ